MTFAVAWLAFPVVLGLVCFGCGLLLEEVTRRRLPVLLLMPMGFAFVIVLVQLATISDTTAELGVPAVGRGGGGRLRALLSVGPHRSVGRPCAAARLRRLRSPGRALGRSDVHRLHQARRHRHLVRAHRPRDGARPQPRGARAVLVRGHARLQPGRRLSDRGIPSARGGPRPRGPGRGMGLPALPRLRRGDAGRRAVRARGHRPSLRARAHGGRRRRGAAGAAVRVRAVGRHQGDRRGGADRAARHPGGAGPCRGGRAARPRPRC